MEADMAMVFKGRTGVPVVVHFSMDSGCNAQYSVIDEGDPDDKPDDNGGSQAGTQDFVLHPEGTTSIGFVATPLCPATSSANLLMTVSQNGRVLEPLGSNLPPGNPARFENLTSGAPFSSSFGLDLT
jgi:hypothetical protein